MRSSGLIKKVANRKEGLSTSPLEKMCVGQQYVLRTYHTSATVLVVVVVVVEVVVVEEAEEDEEQDVVCERQGFGGGLRVRM